MFHKKLIVFGIILTAIIAIGIDFSIVCSQQNKLTPPPFPTSKLNNITIVPTSTRPAHCVPLPNLDKIEKPSSTPTFASLGSTTPVFIVTPQINLPTTEKIIDLSPNLPNTDKASVRVFRCDGSIIVKHYKNQNT